jgi:hypothetical protein
MKTILAVLALSLTFASFAQAETRASCANKIKLAQELAKLTENAWRNGAGDGFAVVKSKLQALNVALDCRTITIDTYCEKALPLASDLVTYTKEYIKGGAAGYDDLVQAQFDAAAVEGACL